MPFEEVAPPTPVYKPKDDPLDYVIKRENGNEWRLSGAATERAAIMTHREYDGSLLCFHKIMKTLGLEDVLRKAGAQEATPFTSATSNWSGKIKKQSTPRFCSLGVLLFKNAFIIPIINHLLLFCGKYNEDFCRIVEIFIIHNTNAYSIFGVFNICAVI